MFKNIKLIGSFVCILLATTTAKAIPIVDTINQNVFVDWYSSYTYTHDLTDDGFVLGTATSGTINIQLFDDNSQDIMDGWEVIIVAVEALDYDTDGLLSSASAFGSNLEINALAQVNTSGLLEVTITSLFGDFYVGQSVLTVDAVDVPEPAILALLGFGFLGLGLARRVRKS